MAGVKNQKLFVAKIASKIKADGTAGGDRYVSNRSFFLSELTSDPSVINYSLLLSTLPGYFSALGIYDPNAAATIDSVQRISQLTDQGTLNNHAVQGTVGSQPLLSRADNKENLMQYSKFGSGTTGWAATRASINTGTTVVKGGETLLFIKEDATVTNTHFFATDPAFRVLRTVGGTGYKVRFVAYSTNRRIQVRGQGGFPGGFTIFNLITGVVDATAAEGSNATMVSTGDGGYICEVTIQANSSGNSGYVEFYIDNGTTNSYSGDNTSGFYIGDISYRHSTADRLETATTNYAQYAGINTNRVAVHDGADDFFNANALGVALNGSDVPFTIHAAVQFLRTDTAQGIFAASRAASSNPLIAISKASFFGPMSSLRRDDAFSSTTVNGSQAISTVTAVISFVFNGTQMSMYHDNVNVLLNGSQNVGTMTLDQAVIGALKAAGSVTNYMNGKLGFLSVHPGAQSDDDRSSWAQYLMYRFETGAYPRPSAGQKTTPVYGILREIEGLGQSMGEVIADDKYGSVQLDVTRGTLSYDTRFYDLFEKETILHQDFTLYSVEKQEDVVDDISNWEIEFTGQVTNINISTSGKTMNLSIRSKGPLLDSPNYQITRTNFPLAPDDSSGRFLPLIFGLVDVIAYPVGDIGASYGGYYLFGTQFYNADALKSFIYENVQANVDVYMKNEFGVYTKVDFPGNPQALGPSQGSGGAFIATTDEIAIDVSKLSSDNNFIITKGRIEYIKNPNAALTAAPTLSLEIYPKRFDIALPVDDAIGKATVAFASQTFSTSPHYFAAFFDKPIFLSRPGYYLVPRIADKVLVGTNPWTRMATNTSQVTYARRVVSDSPIEGVWNPDLVVSDNTFWNLYAVQKGLNSGTEPYGSFILTQSTKSGVRIIGEFPTSEFDAYVKNGNPLPPDIANFDLIAKVSGLRDNSSGTITGVASSLLTRSDHIIKFLYYLQNNYSLTGLDTTTFNPGAYSPQLAGATEDQESYRDIIIEILENSASKLVPRRSTNSLALWAYGVVQPTAAVITEADCTLEEIEITGEDGIVNRIKVNYDKSAVPLNASNQQQQQTNFKASYETSDALSINLYGNRDLSSDFLELKYAKALATITRWAGYKLAQYAKERMKATFTVPFWKFDYRKIDLMDIVELSHIDNPSYFGSASSSREPAISTDGIAPGGDFAIGNLWRRAKRYKMRILSRQPKYSIQAGEPVITFKALVLDNPDEIF